VLVGGNLGEITYTLLGSIVGRRPPLNTRQLLLVNLLTDVAPAMALAVRAPHASVEQLLAEGPERSLGDELNRTLIWRGAGAAVGATTTYALTRPTGSPARAQTAGLVALVGSQLGQTIARSGRDPRVIATGLGSFLVLGAAIQTPVVSSLVGSRPMGPIGWMTGLTGAVVGTTVGIWARTSRRRSSVGRTTRARAAGSSSGSRSSHRRSRVCSTEATPPRSSPRRAARRPAAQQPARPAVGSEQLSRRCWRTAAASRTGGGR
jgi:cation-transporting P-type ATPase I